MTSTIGHSLLTLSICSLLLLFTQLLLLFTPLFHLHCTLTRLNLCFYTGIFICNVLRLMARGTTMSTLWFSKRSTNIKLSSLGKPQLLIRQPQRCSITARTHRQSRWSPNTARQPVPDTRPAQCAVHCSPTVLRYAHASVHSLLHLIVCGEGCINVCQCPSTNCFMYLLR